MEHTFGSLLECNSNKLAKHMLLDVLMHNFVLAVTYWAKVFWHSNCHYNEFCRCTECQYKKVDFIGKLSVFEVFKIYFMDAASLDIQ